MKLFRPDFYAKSIFDIDVSFFLENGIKCVLSDLDNTLDAYDVLIPSEKVVEFKNKLNQAGIELCIVSNNKAKRKEIYCSRLGVKSKFTCMKPFKKKITQFYKSLGYKQDEVILIGDQIITDVGCGKNAKIKVVLTDPITKKDQWTTRFNRLIDKPIRASLRKRGILKGVDITYGKQK